MECLSFPHSLRAEYCQNTLGLGCESPRLSWKLPAAGGREQRAYQIRAASTREKLESATDIFDTGFCEGNESIFVSWPGQPLQSRQQVCWQVRVWIDDHLEATPWSEVAFFEIGLLRQSDWSACWIGFGEKGEKDTPPSPFLRKRFSLSEAPIARARLHASALGLFEFHLNGKKVHPDVVLAPGWTDFRHRVQTMTFDVTSLVRDGHNTLGAILADGWYAGYLSCEGERHIYGHPPALLAQLEIEYLDGRTVRVVSDGSWEGRTGPILSADLYNGEHYDSRRQLRGWSNPLGQAVVEDTAWAAVYERAWPDGIILDPRISEPVRKIEYIAPLAITEPVKDIYIFDLGQNIAGWAKLRYKGKRGQKVMLRFGEMLNADGSLYTENLRTAKVTDCYIFADEEEVEWEPRFTFHGFRYVEVSGLAHMPDKEVITGVVLHNDMRPTGRFECSNPLVNQLESNIRWGLCGNFLEIPTDCPQRDERLGWSGDIQVFSKTAAFLYDTNAFLRKWMRDLRDGQRADGAFPDIAPTFICGFGNAAWADAGVIVPWVVYRRFGDIEILRENYEAMCGWIKFQDETSRDGIRPPTEYGDWLAIDAVTPHHAPVPSDLVGTAYFARTTGIMAEIAKLLGKFDDSQDFARLQDKVIHAFRREYVTLHGRVVGDCQTAYLLALAFDLLPEEQRAAAVDRLVFLIERRNYHLSTGFVGTPLLCPVLSRFGRHDIAMKLLLQDTYPSWLFTVKNGATTMWERWNSYTPDKGFGDVSMNSFNHYAYGAIGEWMVHHVAGLKLGGEAPAYQHILFHPKATDGLNHASVELDTPFGRVVIKWELFDGKMSGELVVPPNAFADFETELGFKSEIFSMETDDAPSTTRYEGMDSVRLYSGRYSFVKIKSL